MLFERNPISFRILKAIAAGLAVAGLLAGAACKEKPFKMPPPEVSITPVIQRDTPIFVEFVGQTKGYEDIDIRARVDGFLQSINFKEGSEVKQGALLYTIDPREYQEKVAQAGASSPGPRPCSPTPTSRSRGSGRWWPCSP